MNLRLHVVLPFLALALATPGFADELISPLPLARDARTKEVPWPSEAATAQYNADKTRFSALIGVRDFDALEQETQRWSNDVNSGKLSMDYYIERLGCLAAAANKSTLPDYEAWVAAKPKSYAAVFALGLVQINIAKDERGAGWAKDTTREQWEAFDRYAQLARNSFLRSLQLTAKPVPSYRQLARLWGMGALGENKAAANPAGEEPETLTAPNCQTLLKLKDITAETSPEPLYYYTCLAVRDAPEAEIPLKPMIELNSIRWRGNWRRSKNFLDQLEKAHAVSDKVLRKARSDWYVTMGRDLYGLMNDKRGAAEAYMKSIEVWPVREAHERTFRWAGDAYKAVSDFDNEIRVYQKAAETFPEKGQYWALLGFAYEHKGDMKNYMLNTSKAALLGEISAQNNVGYFYMVGQRGLPKDLYAARDWLTLAANQGFQHARDKLPSVEKMIQESTKDTSRK